jgi:hypothetical protein
MRISLLLEREPFGRILEETLPDLLAAVTGRHHCVRWYTSARAARRLSQPGEQLWLCNPHMNAIFRPTVSRAALEPVRREFGRSTVAWRRAPQRAWVAAATRRPTAAWLAGARVGIAPALANADDLVLLGGNHRLRLLDRAAGVAHVIAKAGANRAFLEAEIALRAEATDLPIPPLRHVGASATWFTEAYVAGTPANRLPSGSRRAQALGAAHGALRRLALRTMRRLGLRDYVESTVARLAGELDAAPALAGRRAEIERAARALAALATRRAGTIDTAQTHGDFQPGNVLVDARALWLVDWEYTARRPSGFDALTYALAARFPDGLARRVRAAVLAEPGTTAPLLRGWPGVDWETRAGRRHALILYLLEELLVRVRENAALTLVAPSPGTMRFLDELPAATAHLESIAA